METANRFIDRPGILQRTQLTRLEVEGEHPGKTSFDPRPCSPFTQAGSFIIDTSAAGDCTLRDLSTRRNHKPESARAVLLSALRKIRYTLTSRG
jgi:hypothetical protein